MFDAAHASTQLAAHMGMTTTTQIDAFLASKRIGLAGVSTNPDHFSRTVFRELRARGYEVVPIHPTANEIDGVPAFATVCDAAPLDAVYVMTPRRATAGIVHDCHRAGVHRVWVHRGIGAGAVDPDASAYARAHGIDLVDGECIHMFLAKPRAIHRAHRGLRRVIGDYPEYAETPAPHRWAHAIGYGAIAWALATWAMLAIGGMFGWHAGLTSRLVAVPAAFALCAWLDARPGGIRPLATAACFVVVAFGLDAVVMWSLVVRDPMMMTDLLVTWIPLALGFVAAVGVATHYQRPLVQPLTPRLT